MSWLGDFADSVVRAPFVAGLVLVDTVETAAGKPGPDPDVFYLDGAPYYVDSGEAVLPGSPEAATDATTDNPTQGKVNQPSSSLTDKALNALGLGGLTQAGDGKNDPLGLGRLKDVLFYASIVAGIVLALYVAIQIKIALR